jgi:hypothetical protein
MKKQQQPLKWQRIRKYSVPKAVTEMSESLIKERLNVRKSQMVASGALIEGWNPVNPLEFTSHG